MARNRSIWRLLSVAIVLVIGSLMTYAMILSPTETSDCSVLYNIRELFHSNESMDFPGRRRILNNRTNADQLIVKDRTHSKTKDNYLKRVKVLCWIMTSPATLMTKAIHVRNTWGSRCDHTLYMSSVENTTFPAVGLNVSEGRESLWNKTRAAFQYIYRQNYTDSYDWIFKADDDTYVIAENLKYFLRDKNSSDPLYFGHHFKKYVENGYMSGGAGYVLSKTAVNRLVNIGLQSKQLCPDNVAEDLAMGLCLQNVGVIASDTRDSLNRSRFLPLSLHDSIKHSSLPAWFFEYTRYEPQKGLECCSDYLISCHYVKPDDMYDMEYYVYHLRPANPESENIYLYNRTRVPV